MRNNRSSYNNPVITEMLDQAAKIINKDDRREHYMKMQEIIAEDPPGFNIVWCTMIAACYKGVGGFRFLGDAIDNRYVYRIID
jgi:ABC-type transport system substrate-binding protein